MEYSHGQNIKRENIGAVFSAIADSGKTSRAAIAAHTGLSLMTVGKIADALVDAGVLCQAKNGEVTPGRKARILACAPEHRLLLLDLTAKDFRLTVLDLSFNVCHDARHAYDGGMLCEENLIFFLRNAVVGYLASHAAAHLIGMAVLLPGAYDAAGDSICGSRIPELSPLRPGALLQELFPALSPIMLEDTRAAAISALAELPRESADSCLWLSLDRPVSGAFMVNGRLFTGSHGESGCFGEITVGTNFTLDQALAGLREPDELASALSAALHTVIALFDPAQIILESSAPWANEVLAERLTAHLEQKNAHRHRSLPPIAVTQKQMGRAMRGAALHLRNTWLDSAIH
ncbi:MAG: ROK family protein [Clostridia bacterium]|nr:ROK family protein [Clostridia bacterium]